VTRSVAGLCVSGVCRQRTREGLDRAVLLVPVRARRPGCSTRVYGVRPRSDQPAAAAQRVSRRHRRCAPEHRRRVRESCVGPRYTHGSHASSRAVGAGSMRGRSDDRADARGDPELAVQVSLAKGLTLGLRRRAHALTTRCRGGRGGWGGGRGGRGSAAKLRVDLRRNRVSTWCLAAAAYPLETDAPRLCFAEEGQAVVHFPASRSPSVAYVSFPPSPFPLSTSLLLFGHNFTFTAVSFNDLFFLAEH